MNKEFFQDSIKMVKSHAGSKIKGAVLRSQLDDVFIMSEAIMDEYYTTLENLRRDNRLSAEGKLAERQKATGNAHARLDELLKPLEGLQREVQQLQSEAAKSTNPENEVLEFLKQREIRDRMGDDPILEQRYKMAVDSGQNLHMVEAIENSPVPFEFVTDATRQQTAMHKLSASNPIAAERVTDIHLFKTFAESAVNSGRLGINQTANG